jgi:glucokinase
MTSTLCIDLGGTHLRAALAEAGREGDAAPLGAWPAPGNLETFHKILAGLIDAHAVTRVGVAIPGLASGSTGVWVPNLPYLDGVDFAVQFPGVSVALGNDAQFALLAEAALGRARDATDAILLAIGTGIGSAVLADGRIVRGARGAAASFGWACADCADAGDDKLGWLERKASGGALNAIAGRVGLVGGPALISAARAGDPTALAAVAGPAAALGATLSGAVALLGAQTVIVSGGVAEATDLLGPLVLSVLRRHLPPHLRGVTFAPGVFGPRASLVGGGLAAQGHALWSGGGR